MYLFSGIMLIVLASSWLHVPLTGLSDALLDPKNTNMNRLYQVATTFFSMALPAYVFARIMNSNAFPYLGFNDALTSKRL